MQSIELSNQMCSTTDLSSQYLFGVIVDYICFDFSAYSILAGGSKTCLCDCQSSNQNSYNVVLDYSYSAVALSTIRASGNFCALQQF